MALGWRWWRGSTEDAAAAGPRLCAVVRCAGQFGYQLGPTLEDALRGDLSGRDLFDALQALQGQPQTIKDRLDRLVAQRDYECGGALNFISNALLDGFSFDGQRLDYAVAEAQSSYDAAIAAHGTLTPEDIQQINGEQKGVRGSKKVSGTFLTLLPSKKIPDTFF